VMDEAERRALVDELAARLLPSLFELARRWIDTRGYEPLRTVPIGIHGPPAGDLERFYDDEYYSGGGRRMGAGPFDSSRRLTEEEVRSIMGGGDLRSRALSAAEQLSVAETVGS